VLLLEVGGYEISNSFNCVQSVSLTCEMMLPQNEIILHLKLATIWRLLMIPYLDFLRGSSQGHQTSGRPPFVQASTRHSSGSFLKNEIALFLESDQVEDVFLNFYLNKNHVD
jgi:hypothetical protein